MHAQSVWRCQLYSVVTAQQMSRSTYQVPAVGEHSLSKKKSVPCSQYHILCVYVYEFVHIEGIHFNVFLHLKFSVVLFLNRCRFGLGLQQEVSG